MSYLRMNPNYPPISNIISVFDAIVLIKLERKFDLISYLENTFEIESCQKLELLKDFNRAAMNNRMRKDVVTFKLEDFICIAGNGLPFFSHEGDYDYQPIVHSMPESPDALITDLTNQIDFITHLSKYGQVYTFGINRNYSNFWAYSYKNQLIRKYGFCNEHNGTYKKPYSSFGNITAIENEIAKEHILPGIKEYPSTGVDAYATEKAVADVFENWISDSPQFFDNCRHIHHFTFTENMQICKKRKPNFISKLFRK